MIARYSVECSEGCPLISIRRPWPHPPAPTSLTTRAECRALAATDSSTAIVELADVAWIK